MTLKQLCTLHEIAMLRQCIGDETDLDAAEKRYHTLPWRIWQLTQRVYLRVHKAQPEYIWINAKYQGFINHVVMWDHYQLWCKESICHRPACSFMRDPASEFWEETDEEGRCLLTMLQCGGMSWFEKADTEESS